MWPLTIKCKKITQNVFFTWHNIYKGCLLILYIYFWYGDTRFFSVSPINLWIFLLQIYVFELTMGIYKLYSCFMGVNIYQYNESKFDRECFKFFSINMQLLQLEVQRIRYDSRLKHGFALFHMWNHNILWNQEYIFTLPPQEHTSMIPNILFLNSSWGEGGM